MTALVTTATRLDRLTHLVGRFELDILRSRLAAAQRLDASGDRLTVAALGQFKAGKSSLLNSLIGADLLPVLAIPATAVVTTVRHAPSTTATVTFADGREQAIPPADIADYVVEHRNPDNAKQVAQLTVTTTGLGDLPDLEFVDTPGTGSAFDLNTATSLGWLPQAGAVLLAVSATQPLAAADLDLLARLAPHTPHIAVVLTKADLLSPGDLAQVSRFVSAQLRQRTGRTLPVLPYSTLPGRAALREPLHAHLSDDLQARHRELLDTLADHRLGALEADCRRYLALALAAAEAGDASRARLRAGLAVERSRLPELAAEAKLLVRRDRVRLREELMAEAASARDAVTHRLLSRLDAELPDWRGSLRQQSEQFRDWLAGSLAEEFGSLPLYEPSWLAGRLEPAREPLDRLAETFALRLADRVEEALGVRIATVSPVVESPPPAPSSIVLNRVFDSQLDLLSWLVPKRLVGPLVHRHFRRRVPWEVEKNLHRLAARLAGTADRALDDLADAYLAALREELATYDQLATGRRAQPGADELRAAIAELDDPRTEGEPA